MSSPHELDPALLDRVLAGVATPADQAHVAEWIAADPRHAAMLTALREAHARHAPHTDRDTEAGWQAMQSRIEAATVRSISDAPSVRRTGRRSSTVWWRIAATLLITLAGATMWRVRTADVELVAQAGQRVSTTLPDGSRLTLAAGSRARWPRRFGAGSREVQLEGEGFFDVVHDTTQPFRVRVGEHIAEDVGTRFVVRAWPETDGVEVAVEEGAVTLGRDRERSTLLTAGDRGRLSPDGRMQVTHDGIARAAWARGEFIFDNTTLAEALPALGRWYGVTLTASPTMPDRRVTGRFATLPLDPLLETLALALDVRVSRTGSVITLSPR